MTFNYAVVIVVVIVDRCCIRLERPSGEQMSPSKQ